jgi:predicted Zn-dependent protease
MTKSNSVFGFWRIRAAGFLVSVLISSLALVGCVTNPATGKKTLNLVGESQEIKMGQEADKDITASMGVYPDEDLQTYVRNLGSNLASHSERPKLPWTFRVLDDSAVNAFALPGGFIYVTRGILAFMSSEAELAGVVGHEIGHVTAEHSVQRMSSQGLLQVGLGVGMVLSPELQQYGQIISAGMGLLFLKFSRDDESEADSLGLRYMGRANYDKREMIAVMGMLDNLGKESGGGKVPEWLSTHPDPGNRKEKIREQVQKEKADLSGTMVNGEQYLDRIDGIVFGQNPREGYFKENVFYHPDLKFQFEFPKGWSASNTKQTVSAVSQNQDALVQITLASGSAPETAADTFSSQAGVAVESRQAGKIHGLSAVTLLFNVQTEQSVLQGIAVFISYDGKVYQILGYTPSATWPAYKPALESSARSFARLTDPKILAVQPMRLQVVTLDRDMTLEEFNTRYSSPVPMSTLAIINRAEKGAVLAAGVRVKRITGEKVP